MRRNVIVDGAASLPALYRLVLGREDWAESLDVSTDGFIRSFMGPIAAIPFVLAGNNLYRSAAYADRATSAAAGEDATRAAVLAAAVAQAGVTSADFWSTVANTVLAAAAFPLLSLPLVRWLGGGSGYSAMIVTLNWTMFWLYAVLLALAAPLGFNMPVSIFDISGFLLFGLVIYIVWRVARETLTGEISLSLMATLLFLFVTYAANYLANPIGRALG